MSDLPDPIPAATLILMRPGAGAPELLVMERAAHMAFAAGALVFPGGRVDPEDEAMAARHGLPDAAARIAAIRETIEETGAAPAFRPAPDPATAAALREGLARHAPFSGLLESFGLALDLDALTPFARWCPNFRETRRFDTLFYLAEAPQGTVLAEPNPGEASRLFWASAAALLAGADRGPAHLIFPTRRTLERLAQFASIDEARADAARHPPTCITPWIETRRGHEWLCIPEDAGYPVTAEPLATARRS